MQPPTFMLRTSLPTSSTIPTPSWPRIVPGFMPLKVPRIKCTSVPQMVLAVRRRLGVGVFLERRFVDVVQADVAHVMPDDGFR